MIPSTSDWPDGIYVSAGPAGRITLLEDEAAAEVVLAAYFLALRAGESATAVPKQAKAAGTAATIFCLVMKAVVPVSRVVGIGVYRTRARCRLVGPFPTAFELFVLKEK